MIQNWERQNAFTNYQERQIKSRASLDGIEFFSVFDQKAGKTKSVLFHWYLSSRFFREEENGIASLRQSLAYQKYATFDTSNHQHSS